MSNRDRICPSSERCLCGPHIGYWLKKTMAVVKRVSFGSLSVISRRLWKFMSRLKSLTWTRTLPGLDIVWQRDSDISRIQVNVRDRDIILSLGSHNDMLESTYDLWALWSDHGPIVNDNITYWVTRIESLWDRVWFLGWMLWDINGTSDGPIYFITLSMNIWQCEQGLWCERGSGFKRVLDLGLLNIQTGLTALSVMA